MLNKQNKNNEDIDAERKENIKMNYYYYLLLKIYKYQNSLIHYNIFLDLQENLEYLLSISNVKITKKIKI